MRRKSIAWAVLALAAAGTGVGAYAVAGSGKATRTDCPGRIICPATGELVCRDRCPLIDAGRADCPGRVECPLTGELVCRDRCPLGKQAAGNQAAESLMCCRGGE
jgi:hypothetical protein